MGGRGGGQKQTSSLPDSLQGLLIHHASGSQPRRELPQGSRHDGTNNDQRPDVLPPLAIHATSDNLVNENHQQPRRGYSNDSWPPEPHDFRRHGGRISVQPASRAPQRRSTGHSYIQGNSHPVAASTPGPSSIPHGHTHSRYRGADYRSADLQTLHHAPSSSFTFTAPFPARLDSVPQPQRDPFPLPINRSLTTQNLHHHGSRRFIQVAPLDRTLEQTRGIRVSPPVTTSEFEDSANVSIQRTNFLPRAPQQSRRSDDVYGRSEHTIERPIEREQEGFVSSPVATSELEHDLDFDTRRVNTLPGGSQPLRRLDDVYGRRGYPISTHGSPSSSTLTDLRSGENVRHHSLPSDIRPTHGLGGLHLLAPSYSSTAEDGDVLPPYSRSNAGIETPTKQAEGKRSKGKGIKRKTDNPDPHVLKRKHGRKAAVACDFCKKRKLRCSNERPQCKNCEQRQRECLYGEPRRRGPGKAPRGSRPKKSLPREKRQSSGSTNIDDVGGRPFGFEYSTLPFGDPRSTEQDPPQYTPQPTPSPMRIQSLLVPQETQTAAVTPPPPTPSPTGEASRSDEQSVLRRQRLEDGEPKDQPRFSDDEYD